MYKIILLLLLVGVFAACETVADAGVFVVGSDYLSVNNKVIQIDTLTANMATINFDSLVTSEQNRILIGNYDDPIFGRLKSVSYFQLSNSVGDYSVGNTSASDTEYLNYVYDSIALVLKYDDYYFGDTTKVQTIDVHRILEKVKPANSEDSRFYNNSSLAYDSKSLATYSYKPRPTEKDSIHVRLDDAFGEALFLRLKNREITNFDEFTEYLKGMVLVPNSTNSSNIVGFNLSSELRVYYSKYQSDAEESIVKSFTIADATKQYNAISSDKTGTLIQDLPISSSSLSSNLSGNKGFIQSGSGVACRIDFPTLKEMNYIAENGTVVDAVLKIKPVKNSYSDAYPLPDSLQVYVADNLNRISGTLNDSKDIPIYAVLSQKKDEFNENVYYALPLGGFLQKELLKQSDSRKGLILTIPNYNKEINRVVLGDQNLYDNKMELQIFYLTY
ncbi:DUF4270 family protein [Flavobacterium agrisoli]|uniref:DUF4270 family protein n=1 Tax=Flavobacterium agrisoli TaxID=2793066 RepID=A0A934PNR4_9FLAO|nr:DUF4270 family protein [Flavobacterium agrisoli]MBK0370283.1 DUF4270 family protein [Flavobacterium agrisoli]